MTNLPALTTKFNSALATKASNSVLVRTFKELDDLSGPAEPTSEWLGNVLNLLQFSKDIEIGFGHAKAYALAIIHSQWDIMPLELRTTLGYTFMGFAKEITGKARSTIDNDVRTARVWLIDKVSPGKPIEIKERGMNGKPILNEYGKTVTKLVEFEPYMVDMTKLLHCNARAAAGKMTERLWEMLIDPFFSCEDLILEMANGDEKGDISTPSYFLLGPMLCFELEGETYQVAEFNWEAYDSGGPVKIAIDRIMHLLDIVFDEDAIHTIEHRSKQ